MSAPAEECGVKFWVPQEGRVGTERTRAGEACYLGWQTRMSHRPGAGEALNEDLPELLGTEASGGDQPAALSKLTSVLGGPLLIVGLSF